MLPRKCRGAQLLTYFLMLNLFVTLFLPTKLCYVKSDWWWMGDLEWVYDSAGNWNVSVMNQAVNLNVAVSN